MSGCGAASSEERVRLLLGHLILSLPRSQSSDSPPPSQRDQELYAEYLRLVGACPVLREAG